MKGKSTKQNRPGAATVEIKRVTPGGRILYDVTSILKTERAKEHLKTLREVAETTAVEQSGKPGR